MSNHSVDTFQSARLGAHLQQYHIYDSTRLRPDGREGGYDAIPLGVPRARGEGKLF